MVAPDAGFLKALKPMSIEANTAEKVTDDVPTDGLITGPWTEPLEQGGKQYWRCADCGRESVREGDLRRARFHPTNCEARR